MPAPDTARRFSWLPILLIGWNLFDIAVHIAVNAVEPLRIAGNIVGIAAALVVLLGIARAYTPSILVLAAALVVGLNTVEALLHGYRLPMLIFVGVSVFLLLRLAQVSRAEATAWRVYQRWWVALAATLGGIAILTSCSADNGTAEVPATSEPSDVQVTPDTPPAPSEADDGQEPRITPIVTRLHNGELVAADYWRDEPMILSAGMGFDNIIGLPEVNEETVREADGSWYGSVTCTSGEEPGNAAYTSAAPSRQVAQAFKGFSEYDDGLPIVFSWPVATETVDMTDFQFTLNTGDIVFPNSIGMWPNWELNERNTVVAFGDFGNRGLSSENDVIFPVRLDIVEDDTPLLLVGPGGEEFNAVGLSWETDTTPYDSGPALVGAKLNFVGDESAGEGGIRVLEQGIFGAFIPNDEFAVYDEGDFRIRVLTTGGFSPDGVTGLRPDSYADFFRVHATGEDGETVLLEQVGEEYAVAGGTLRVVGLSDLGQRENPDEGIFYDDCYQEDRDNYIDIILVGDEAAARSITFVEIPALEGGYGAFYNPGGPGPEPFAGVRYTAPGPPDLEPVINALDDPMRVDRAAR